MADNSPLADWLATIKPDIATQRRITEFLTERIAPCEIAGCDNVTLRDPNIDYTCFICFKACCLASHMAYISLLEKYCNDFIEAADYPEAEYVCNTCLAIVDADYRSWLETPHMLRDWFHWKFLKERT
jgi:hypothetical protein